MSAIVTLTGDASPARIQALEAAVGDLGVTHRFKVIDGFAATMTAEQVRALADAGGVVHVEENSVVHATNDTAQASFGVSAARAAAPAVDGDADGNVETCSAGDLVAAVIDTGIDAAHRDLDEGEVIGWRDLVANQPSPYDDNGHGSHVAATIAGEGDARADRLFRGVAPGAALVGVKVLDGGGSGTMANVTAGIDWVVANKAALGIEAINLSLGTSGCSNGTDATSVAVNNAHAAGIVVAVAAGNSGAGTCTISSPGAAADALTVGAMADMGVAGFKQAYFSSRGKTLDGRIKPDVSAPGVNITSADNGTGTGYAVFSGTSMATPFVAGTALLMRDRAPALTAAAVKSTMMTTAQDWGRGGDNKVAGSTGADIDYGAGRLDAFAAIEAVGADLGAGPAMPSHQLLEGSLSGTGAQVDYPLNVTGTTFPIAATLIHPGVTGATASSPDFDLYLIAPNGTQVAAAETTRRQDELGFVPSVTGTYTLRVRSFSGSGAYFVDVSANTAPDTTAPAVSTFSPANGATGVARSTNVSVTFNEPMDQAATQTAFTLTAGGSPLAGTFAWSGNTMTFDPAADLAGRVAHVATVGTGAKDRAGNSLPAAASAGFTTTTSTTVTAFPSAATIVTGTLRSGTAASLGADDNVFYQVNSTTSGTRTSAWYGSFGGVSNAASNLQLTYRGSNSITCTQTLWVWNWSTSGWTQLGGSNSVQGETQLTRSVTGSLANYVSGDSGAGEVRIRVRCTRTDGSFIARGDLMRIVYTTP